MKAEITIDKEDVRDALIRIAREMIGPRADEMDFSVQSDWRLNDITILVKDKAELVREERARLEMEERRKAREAEKAAEPAQDLEAEIAEQCAAASQF